MSMARLPVDSIVGGARLIDMIEIVDVSDAGRLTLADYEKSPDFTPAVRELRAEAQQLVPHLQGRTVWMVNSTARGGGVAEMMPKMVSIFRELGVSVEWAVINADRNDFFDFTKRLHNMIHGSGVPGVSDAERSAYEDVNHRNAESLAPRIKADDILVVHDPQPMALGAEIARRIPGLKTIWRCHIGTAERIDVTSSVWRFLRDYSNEYDAGVFSATEYIPTYFTGRSRIIYPSIDPLSHKNRPLSAHKIVGILCNARLAVAHQPVLTPEFEFTVERLQSDGSFGPANEPEEIGLLFRPIVTQVSRWDRLKGYGALLEGFVKLKEKLNGSVSDPQHRRRLELLRLVLAGPDPASIQDDPEGREVLEELIAMYKQLAPELQRDVAIIALPMQSRKHNALMVNALQRCSTVVVQNSLKEGFGLTATEAMWKGIAMMGSQAVGLRQQIRDHIDGRLVANPEDAQEIADTLDAMLADTTARDLQGESGRRRAYREFLIFSQIRNWLRLLGDVARA